jgi:FtsH-binding integral membrane protein
MAMSDRARRLLLTADGVFLAVVGGLQVVFELLSYYRGAGPLGDDFERTPYIIGWVENHGLALLIGLLFLLIARRNPQRFWHGFALAVHVLLGLANIIFWSSFVHFDKVPMGVAATVAHAIFVALHAVALVTRGQPSALAPRTE